MTAIVILASAEVDKKQWYTISVPPAVTKWITTHQKEYTDYFRINVSEFDVPDEVLVLIKLTFSTPVI